MDSGLQTRDKWLETMEKNRLSMLFKCGYEENNDYKQAWLEYDSNQRREVFTEFYHPDVTQQTDEGAPYINLTAGVVRETGYVAVDYTGQIAYTHQMKRDNKYREIEEQTWGLGESASRRPHEEAVRAMWEGFDLQKSGDGKPWFAADHPLKNSNKLDDNLLTDPFGPTGVKNAIIKLMKTKNEHGKPLPMGKGEITVFGGPSLLTLGRQMEKENDWLPDSSDFNRNVYKLKFVCLPFFAMCPYAFADTMWFACDKKYTKNYMIVREAPIFNTWTDFNTDNHYAQVRQAHVFAVVSHRGWVGSKGQGS